MLEACQIGPFSWWRWAVVSRRFSDIPGVGFWSKRAALDFWRRAYAEFDSPPYLVKRTGWRTYKVVR